MTIPLLIKRSVQSPLQTVHSKEFYEDIEQYTLLLRNKELPVIYSLHHLCLLAGVNVQFILNLFNSSRVESYKRFKLKKKKGGYRVIQTPSEELKYLQRWILSNILEKQSSHDSCKGFDKSSSIKINAETHLNQESILKLDLLRFFDSISEKQVYRIFRGLGYHGNVAVAMAKVCTIVPTGSFINSFKKEEQTLKQYILSHGSGILPQGAPTSPKLSNIFCYQLDNRLTKFAKKNGLKYSRYADDLTFSGNYEKISTVKKAIVKIIKDEKLYINHSKTKILKRGSPFFVTGLSVNSSVVKIPKRRKKDIEHHLYHCLKSVEKHVVAAKIDKRNFKDWLFGNIAFVYSVEKETGERYFEHFNKINWPI